MKPASILTSVTALEDRRALRATLGQFATGVAIVTACSAQGSPVGLTINSFASLSLDPPLVLWSLASTSSIRPTFEAAPIHAINILAVEQAALARRFSARDVERFAGLAHRAGPYGAVLIGGALAHLVCRVRDRRKTGDHVLFVSEVVHHRFQAGEPLIFHASRYCTIGPPLDFGRYPAELAQQRAISLPA
jgi:unspecific monooxygenase